MSLLEDLHEGVDVYSADDHKVGKLRHVVVNRRSLRVTHIVVDVGFRGAGHHVWEGGHGLTYDRELPAAAIASVSDERVTLRLSTAEVRDAPPFTDEHVALEPSARLRLLEGVTGMPELSIVARVHEEKDERDIEAGTHVWRQHPHRQLGEIDRVLVDPASGDATALVIKRGFLRPHDFVMPMRYVSEILDDIVRAEISDAELADLQEFRPDDEVTRIPVDPDQQP